MIKSIIKRVEYISKKLSIFNFKFTGAFFHRVRYLNLFSYSFAILKIQIYLLIIYRQIRNFLHLNLKIFLRLALKQYQQFRTLVLGINIRHQIFIKFLHYSFRFNINFIGLFFNFIAEFVLKTAFFH